jgi:hypothetical protein
MTRFDLVGNISGKAFDERRRDLEALEARSRLDPGNRGDGRACWVGQEEPPRGGALEASYSDQMDDPGANRGNTGLASRRQAADQRAR